MKPIEEATWLSPIVVMPKKNEKLKICVDFGKLNVATKKYPYLLPFTNEVINIIVKHEVYTFLDGFLKYHQISIHYYKIVPKPLHSSIQTYPSGKETMTSRFPLPIVLCGLLVEVAH